MSTPSLATFRCTRCVTALAAKISCRRSAESAGRPAGQPRTTSGDQESEPVSRVINRWAHRRGSGLVNRRAGKPADTAFAEVFKGRCRAERLNRCPRTHGATLATSGPLRMQWKSWGRAWVLPRGTATRCDRKKVPTALTKSGASAARHPARCWQALPTGPPTPGSDHQTTFDRCSGRGNVPAHWSTKPPAQEALVFDEIRHLHACAKRMCASLAVLGMFARNDGCRRSKAGTGHAA